jgi:hypothetical protein
MAGAKIHTCRYFINFIIKFWIEILMQYKLTITENQAKAISIALDFYSRISGGQFEEITSHFPWRNFKDHDELDKATEIFTDLKCLLTGLKRSQPNMGLHTIPERGKIAYDLHQVIRHRLANDNPDKSHKYSVDFDTPRKTSQEPLAEIESL